MNSKPCPNCRELFYRKPSLSLNQWLSQEACGPTCAIELREQRRVRVVRPTKSCVICRGTFSKPDAFSAAQWEARQTCSMQCGRASSRRTYAARRPALFWAKVDRSRGLRGCWVWRGSTDVGGYGKFDDRHAHRVAWELTTGDTLTPDVYVCHRCDSPPCCNPAHLFLGNHAANMLDMTKKGRSARGERAARSRLTSNQVQSIRLLYAGGLSAYRLGLMFKIAKSSIQQAVTRKTWKHI